MKAASKDNFESAISLGRTLLAEGSMYDLLKRGAGEHFDSQLAHLGLIYSEKGREVLTSVYSEYIRAADQTGFPIVIFTPTWRANQERVVRSQLAHHNVNSDAVEFVESLREKSGTSQIFIGGLIGCKNDCYDASQALNAFDSEKFHSMQINQLARTSIDFLFASTLPSVEEAMGMAKVMSGTNLPYVLSFVVDSASLVMDGTPIVEAFKRVDSSVSRTPLGYFVNCIHPDTFLNGISEDKSTRNRIAERLIGFQGNTARCDPRQFENLVELQSEDPQKYAERVMEVRRELGAQILGGCCGTNPSHIHAIGKLLREVC